MKTSVLYAILTQLLVVDAAYQTQKPDPCLGLAAKSPVSYKAALACYHNHKLTDEIRTSTIDTIIKTLPFYSFIDVSKQSPEYNVPSQVDIEAEVRKIGKQNFQSEADFQNTLTKFFISLNDGHTRYTSCFSQFGFVQPFPLYSVVGSHGQTQVKVLDEFNNSPDALKAWKAQGIDVNKYAGAEVLRINGLEPLEYLERFAKEYVGISRDMNSNINFALARSMNTNKKWGITYGAFKGMSLIPNSEKLSFTFRVKSNEERVEVPYLVFIPPKFNNTAQFYENFCKPQVAPSKPKSVNSNSIEFGTQQVVQMQQVKMEAGLPQMENLRFGNPLSEPLVSGQYANAYILGDGSTGVLALNSFALNPVNPGNLTVEIFNAFKAFKDRKAKKLILDLSNNGGGVICWGYQVMEYLFPNAKQNYFNTDMHSTPLLREMSKRPKINFLSPTDFNDENGRIIKTTTAWDSVKTYHRGTVRDSSYTPLFQDKCGPNFLKPLFNADNSPPFKKENIALVTNSICYSTCALLANGMQELHDIKNFALGGLPHKPSTVGSLAGGMIAPFDALSNAIQFANLTRHPQAPQPFKSRTVLTFTMRQAYSTKFKELRPLEFTWLPAKNKINFNMDNVFNPYLIWQEVSSKF